MIARLRDWLAWNVLLPLLWPALQPQMQRMNLLEAWLKNIDAALWKVDQAQRQIGMPEDAGRPSTVADIKSQAETIRKEIESKKVAFPIHLEDLK